MEGLNPFLAKHKENADMNQYWYSKPTIQFMVDQVTQMCQPTETSNGECLKCAFLSTPSIYFSLKDKAVKKAAKVFDIDETFGTKDKNFVYFDFNKWEELDESLHGAFDMVVIDPPFITREVWEKYADCGKLLLKKDGPQMWFLSTIDENEAMIKELTGSRRIGFRPSIPNLVYQYSFYASYDNENLDNKNAEIPEFE